jgi:hypothetical protein
LDVYEPGARSFAPAAARGRIRLTDVEPFRSTAEVLEGQIQPVSRAVLRERAYPDFKLKVCFPGLAASAALQSIKSALAAYPAVAPSADESDCQLRVRQDAGHVLTEGGDLSERSPRVPLGPDTTKRVVDQVLQWARWQGVLTLANPAPPFSVRLRLTPAVSAVRPGDRIEIAAENLSALHLYLTALDLSSDGSVAVLYPRPGEGSEALPPHGSGTLTKIEFFVPEGRESVLDTIKVFATTAPLDARVFAQAAARGDDPARTASADPLAALLENAAFGRPRGSRPVPLGGWVTAQQAVTVARSAPALAPPAPGTVPVPAAVTTPVAPSEPGALGGFVLHFAEGRPRGEARGISDLCAPDTTRSSPPCWQYRSISPDGSTRELVPGGAQGSRGAPAPGAAWDEAYRLRRQTGAQRVEPAFEFDQQNWGIEDQPASRGGKNRPDKEAARKDPEWSLRHIRVPQAWKLMQGRGRADGEEGKSVVIAHPDTGYREHREFWDADEAKSRVLYKQGHDFFDDDPNPFDEMDTGGLVPNPGHGTKSGSTIVSPKGKQWPGACSALGVPPQKLEF